MSINDIQVALADSTDYNPAQFQELQLRQSWHQAGVPSDNRVRLAGVGLTQLDLWSTLGETAAKFLESHMDAVMLEWVLLGGRFSVRPGPVHFRAPTWSKP